MLTAFRTVFQYNIQYFHIVFNRCFVQIIRFVWRYRQFVCVHFMFVGILYISHHILRKSTFWDMHHAIYNNQHQYLHFYSRIGKESICAFRNRNREFEVDIKWITGYYNTFSEQYLQITKIWKKCKIQWVCNCYFNTIKMYLNLPNTDLYICRE